MDLLSVIIRLDRGILFVGSFDSVNIIGRVIWAAIEDEICIEFIRVTDTLCIKCLMTSDSSPPVCLAKELS